ncbi:hypothetical protein DAPPUDRAFT_250855 [Daphnia pulex]|uniref:Uncharacterized protein n=1 Tax=Daphnia pulex TaxID=6669 RepID=E9GZD7_DAPPU|nr:hypothetical protein DAPPUDRAFT_250855 [Daphnia pulex]|eukprot:EFX75178.1 hypothetical protein DAPPUDRAFT_250855 [Daphnia pulex]
MDLKNLSEFMFLDKWEMSKLIDEFKWPDDVCAMKFSAVERWSSLSEGFDDERAVLSLLNQTLLEINESEEEDSSRNEVDLEEK